MQPFDAATYKREFLTPLKRATTLPDDLLRRYAIDLPATDSEIAARVKEVRACWNQIPPGNPARKAAQLCIAADEDLRKLGLDRELTWKDLASKQAKQNSDAVEEVVRLAQERAGSTGVATTTVVGAIATSLHVDPTAALGAVATSGVRLIDPTTVPDIPLPHMSESQFRTLQSNLATCSTTVTELLHPGCGTHELLDRFAAAQDPSIRLDGEAVANQIAAVERRAVSASTVAAKGALQLLRTFAAAGGDLRQVALLHLLKSVEDKTAVGSAALARELVARGLSEPDAAALAVVAVERAGTSTTGGVGKIEALLVEGRLREAKAALATVGGTDKAAAIANRVKGVEEEVERLITSIGAAVKSADEVRAEGLLATLEALSIDDAEATRAATPVPPPLALTVGQDGNHVRLHWRPNVGHTDITYEVVRSTSSAPFSPAAGTLIERTHGDSLVDVRPPVAEPTHYSVFAVQEGRATSRPISGTITLLPPVDNAKVDVGSDSVTVHWTVHPQAHSVTARQRDGRQVPVKNNTAHLAGLVEGESVQVDLTARYLNAAGVLIEAAAVPVSATPRSEAKPVRMLKAKPVDQPGDVRVRISWTPVDHSEVRVHASPRACEWQIGTWITSEDLSSFGAPLTGTAQDVRGERVLEVPLPQGVHHLVAFSVGGTGIVVGAATSVGVTTPVAHLEATPLADVARLSWVWPESADIAEVMWTSGTDQDMRRVTRVDYQRGIEIPLGTAETTVEVRALVNAGGRIFASPSASLTLTGADVAALAYQVSSSPSLGPFGGRSKRVVVSSETGCTGIKFEFVAASGSVMPTDATAGTQLCDREISLPPGGSETFEVTVPRTVRKPYWVRGFVTAGRASLIDPPVTSLKEA